MHSDPCRVRPGRHTADFRPSRSRECSRPVSYTHLTRRPTGQISMRRASAGVIETGSWSTRVTVELLRLGRRWPPLRAQLAHVAPGGGGLACPTRLAGGRPRARPREVTTDHLFFRLTLAKLRYSSTRRRRAPGSTYGFNRLLPSRVSNKRATDSRDVARAYLSSAFHVTCLLYTSRCV